MPQVKQSVSVSSTNGGLQSDQVSMAKPKWKLVGLGEPGDSSKKLPFIGHSPAEPLTFVVSSGPQKTLHGKLRFRKIKDLSLSIITQLPNGRGKSGSKQPGYGSAFL